MVARRRAPGGKASNNRAAASSHLHHQGGGGGRPRPPWPRTWPPPPWPRTPTTGTRAARACWPTCAGCADAAGAVVRRRRPTGGAQPTGRGRLVGRDRGRTRQLATAGWGPARAGGGVPSSRARPASGKSRLVRELTTAVAERRRPRAAAASACPTTPCRWRRCAAAVERYLRAVTGCRRPSGTRRSAGCAGPPGRGGPLLRALSPLLADAGAGARRRRAETGTSSSPAPSRRSWSAWPTSAGGAVLHLDDVQWLDGPTRRVLQQLTSRLPGTPLLVVAHQPRRRRQPARAGAVRADMDATPRHRHPAPPAGRDAVDGLVADHLGGVRLPPRGRASSPRGAAATRSPSASTSARSSTPGCVAPDVGRLAARPGRARPLELSGDALDLVLRPDRRPRRGEPPPAGGAAAAGGAVPRPTWWPRSATSTARQARRCSPRPSRARLVAAPGAGGGTRSCTTGSGRRCWPGWTPPALRRLHQRIADVLDAAAPDRPPARLRDRPPLRARRATAPAERVLRQRPRRRPAGAGRPRAGRGADFLEIAARSPRRRASRRTPTSPARWAPSCARPGAFGEALRAPGPGAATPSRTRCAGPASGAARRVHTRRWEPDRRVRRGPRAAWPSWARRCRATGSRSPLTTLVVVPRRRWSSAAPASASARRRRAATASGAGCRPSLYDAGAYASAMRMRRRHAARCMACASLYSINRLGPGAEYARHLAGLA